MADAAAPRLVLIGGGARCGKSAFALQRAAALGARRAFVATAMASDAEMAARIERHRQERGAGFTTVEAPVDLENALTALDGIDVVVIDCLTLWLSNLLLRDETEQHILERVDALIAVVARADRHHVIVTNEVGMSLVPPNALGRRFRDLSGFAHQRIARVADEIYFGLLGTLLRLKPAPVVLIPEET
jgi:adenosylcobinamide kinase / adenosylcobinamide-phosphate guanylyltransferase